ncbi:MAG: CoA pyrophosphatase [Gammaproteobacteria bacterium]|nr:CoA pyrophosphatase [Gammaproteobacteria bacterium]
MREHVTAHLEPLPDSGVHPLGAGARSHGHHDLSHRDLGHCDPGDHDLNGRRPGTTDRPARPAAVLIPIVEHPGGATVLLTERTRHLKHHAGQVSFPGGRANDEDHGVIDTALRETWEEIGLASHHIEIAGLLDNYLTGSGFLVTPVVGFVRPGFALKLDPFEVATAFEVPLAFFMDPANHAIESRLDGQAERRYYAFRHSGHLIWGATAGLLMNLYRRISGQLPTA